LTDDRLGSMLGKLAEKDIANLFVQLAATVTDII
jgi:hypothetical protein